MLNERRICVGRTERGSRGKYQKFFKASINMIILKNITLLKKSKWIRKKTKRELGTAILD